MSDERPRPARTALVTGATGFLGSHLVPRLLKEGYAVRALARRTTGPNAACLAGAEVVEGDLKRRETLKRAVAGVDVVFHLGAAVRGSWEDYEETTVRGTRWMLELSLEASVKRFIHVSSLAVYRPLIHKNNARVDEAAPADPHPERLGPYAYSKIEAERLITRFQRKGLPTVVLRLGLVYGPRGRVFFPHLGAFAGKRLFLSFGKGRALLPLIYVDNAMDALVLAGESAKAIGRVYNLVDGDGITQRDYLTRLRARTKGAFFIAPTPVRALLFVSRRLDRAKKIPGIGRALDALPLPSSYRMASKLKSLRFDASRAREELAWCPRISLEEGLERTFAWHFLASGDR